MIKINTKLNFIKLISLILYFIFTSCTTSVHVEKGSSTSVVPNENVIDVSFSLSNQSVLESAGVVTIDLVLSAARELPTSISVVTSGEANSPDDYSFSVTQPIVIPAGVIQAQLQVSIENDQTVESNENFQLMLSTVEAGVTLGAVAIHRITIVDDDGFPQIFNFNLPSSNQLSMPNSVVVTFSKNMNPSTVEDINNWIYTCTGGGVGQVSSVNLLSNMATVNLTTTTQPLKNHSCSLTASTAIQDLVGNALTGDLVTRQVFYNLVSAPSVTSVTSTTANGWYKVGDVINIEVTFDEAVTLVGSTAQILLETGASDAVVNLTSGSGTTTLSGTFEVQAGFATSDLNYAAISSFTLNGSTIIGVNSQIAANLTLPGLGGGSSLAGQKNIGIDTQAPVAPSNLVDGNYFNLTTQSPLITFDNGNDTQSGISYYEAQVVNGTSQVIRSWSVINSGDPITSLTLIHNTQYFIQLRARDTAGNFSSVVTSDGWVVDTMSPPLLGSISLGSVPQSTSQSPNISWASVTDVGLSGISHYQVQLWQAASAIGSWVNLVSGQSLSSLSLTVGDSYFVKVRAVDAAGNIGTEVSSASWIALADGTDVCLTTNPAIGTVCDDGSIYAGIITVGSQSYKIATTPSNCADHPSGGLTVGVTADFAATCSGSGDDTLQKRMQRPSLVYDGDYDLLTNLDKLGTDLSVKSSKTGSVSSQAVIEVTPSNPPFAYCDKMIFAGKTDWYLPNKTEMTYLYCRAQTPATGAVTYPLEDPNCATYTYGSDSNKLLGFGSSFRTYNTSTFESSYWDTAQVYFQNGIRNGEASYGVEGEVTSNFVRCIRRIATVP